MKTIKFEKSLVSLVLSGENSTWRMFDDKDLSIGDELSLVNKETGEEFGKAKIKDIIIKKFKDIDEGDFKGHEKFSSLENMENKYREYYGDKFSINEDVKMIEVDLLR